MTPARPDGSSNGALCHHYNTVQPTGHCSSLMQPCGSTRMPSVGHIRSRLGIPGFAAELQDAACRCRTNCACLPSALLCRWPGKARPDEATQLGRERTRSTARVSSRLRCPLCLEHCCQLALALLTALQAPESAVLDPPSKFTVGVCAMEKKARSKPMTAILSRITSFNEFEVIVFGDKVHIAYATHIAMRCSCTRGVTAQTFAQYRKSQQHLLPGA